MIKLAQAGWLGEHSGITRRSGGKTKVVQQNLTEPCSSRVPGGRLPEGTVQQAHKDFNGGTLTLWGSQALVVWYGLPIHGSLSMSFTEAFEELPTIANLKRVAVNDCAGWKLVTGI